MDGNLFMYYAVNMSLHDTFPQYDQLPSADPNR
jgi:hypothetical protein